MRSLRPPLIPLLCLAAVVSAQAAELEHLGSPPPGEALVELEASGSVTPVQLAGTVCPPTLVLNGQPLKPQESASTSNGGKETEPTLIVGGQSQTVSGKSGRFFVQLSPEQSAVPSLEILMRCPAGAETKTFSAVAKLGHIFLDGPIHSRKMIASREKGAGGKVEVPIAGTIPQGATLTLEDGGKFASGPNAISVKVPPGHSVIVGQLTLPDGTTRNLSVPVTLTLREYDPLKPILSVEPPKNWSVPEHGTTLHGITNAGAHLSLDGRDVDVDRDGSFKARLEPPSREWNAQFRVVLASGGTATFSQAVSCPDFKLPQGDCPPGSSLIGAAPPLGFEQSCETPLGIRNGPFKRWHKNGQLAEAGDYALGGREGNASTWYENGKLKSQGAFAQGKEEGTWEFAYESGKEKERGEYLRGERVCDWLHWDESTGAQITQATRQVPECIKSEAPWSIGRFRVGADELFQSTGGASTTWNLQWTPRLHLGFLHVISLQGYLGASFPGKQGGGVATLVEYGGRFCWDRLPGLHDLSLELGGGGQTWIGFGGTFPQAGIFLAWNLPKPLLLGWLNLFYLGDEIVFLPGDTVQQIQLGVGLGLF